MYLTINAQQSKFMSLKSKLIDARADGDRRLRGLGNNNISENLYLGYEMDIRNGQQGVHGINFI